MDRLKELDYKSVKKKSLYSRLEKEKMIFKWESAAIKNYGPGYIFVEADNIQQAREIAWNGYLKERAVVDSTVNARMPWRFMEMPDLSTLDTTLASLDEYEVEEVREFEQKLRADLAADPEIIAPGNAIFMRGSD